MAVEIAPGIMVDSEVHFGKPVIKGTRVPVAVVLDELAAGTTMEDLGREYGITPKDIDENEPLVFICDSNAVEQKRQFVFKWQQHGRGRTWVLASFDKGDCIDILSPGSNRIKVAGRLNSGRCYYADCCIYVYKPRPFRRWWKPPK